MPCCDPDPVTGHWPHWVKVDPSDPADKWFIEAYNNTLIGTQSYKYTTFEAVGPHFNGNPYGCNRDTILEHGAFLVDVKRDFESIKEYLKDTKIEGLVFWLNGEPVCKIKRSDFGFEWPVKK